MDPSCAWTKKGPLSGRSLGHVTQFRNFWTPYNFKFGTDIDDEPSLRMNYKTTPKWAWPVSGDLLGSLYNF